MRAAKLILWDEASMSHKAIIEAVDSMLQDVCNTKQPFGGKVVVFGGDFRQVLPVVPKATKEECINASLVSSKLWPLFEKIRLTENMQALEDPSFSLYLLQIGNGTEPEHSDHKVKIPAPMIVPYIDDVASVNDLISGIFPNINLYAQSLEAVINRAILTLKKDYVDKINNIIIDKFPGSPKIYYSFDETLDQSQQAQYEDFLHSLTFNGIPQHELILKQNCPIILLRNIDPGQGLCNETRLICKSFQRNIIDAEIATGHHIGECVFIPRIPFLPLENEKVPFPFKRTQFPIRLCFAMTINKAQGQTLDHVGIYLPEPVFSHGQLYVALSRTRNGSSIRLLIVPSTKESCLDQLTTNVVYKEVLHLASLA
ncbi:ATP-dependent DNA helicase [Quillaja saponaria]|uniref:ATP-dependent DNA helicase n=1 Tax=Quillaja saponaria TaxID=32244 RepID=A0AAD7KVW3_QUISA|nr:ATP-dependent DNA helicase [Quillaja saponaria]